MADLPTEPSREEAGPQAALPPVPAEPTTLTGSLAGSDGRYDVQEIGFYASPVFSKIVISGLLTYSGLSSGYLPGTGQVDAAGIFIPNQCAASVRVRIAYTGGGQTVAGPACPYPARQIGSYTSYGTVRGTVYMERYPGPPGSCYKGVTPCISYTGSQTVEVTPEEGRLELTPNKTLAQVGGGIIVTAKGIWTQDSSITVPMTPRLWSWQGQGPQVGGGPSITCSYYPSANQCMVLVRQSGHVVLEAIVNGKVKTQKVWIAVMGGDSLPTPPLPPEDSLPQDPPDDSIPGGGGDGGCGGDTLTVGSGGLALVDDDCGDEETPPTAVVKCESAGGSSDIARGENVTCTVVVTPTQTFTVAAWQATPDGNSTQSHPGSNTLAGPAVVGTDVGATITLADGTGLTATTARFNVLARGWAKLQLPAQAPNLISHRMDPYGSMTNLPIQGQNYSLGLFALAFLDFSGLPVTVTASGPNQGYAFFTVPPAFPVPMVYTHPQLVGGAWYTDQDGGRDRSTRAARCDKPALPVLEQKVLVHEGMTRINDSHWGIAYDIFELSQMTPNWEALVDASGSATAIQFTAQGQFNAIWQRYLGVQAAFDAYDYPLVFGSLGCALDMDQSPADG